MKRFIFDNLVYKMNDVDIMLLNLTSFRRKIVTCEMLDKLSVIETKLNQGCELTETERLLYRQLQESKQILTKDIEEKVNAILTNEAAINSNKIPVRSITLNLTHSCNFNCYYCYQNVYKHRPEYLKHMTTQDVDDIVSYLSSIPYDTTFLDEVVISGGEPLLEGNIDAINYICKVVKSKKKTIFSNGVNILKYAPDVNYSKIDEFQISLDGTSEVMVNVNGYSGSVNSILDGIEYVLKLGKTVSLVVMWTKHLESHIEEFISIIQNARLRNYKNFEMKIIVAKNYYNYNNLDTNIYNLEYIKDCRKKYNGQLRKMGCSIELFSEVGFLKTVLHRPINKIINPRYKRCDINRSIPMVFEPNGEVHWCTCLGKSNGVIGNFKDNTIDMNRIEKYGTRTVLSMNKCKLCKLKYVCSGGCVLGVPDESDLHTSVCSIFDNEYFWEHLEDFV